MTTKDNLILVQNVALIKAAVPDLASQLEETNVLVYSGTRYRSIALVNVSFSKSVRKSIPSNGMAQIYICSFAQSYDSSHALCHDIVSKGLDSILPIISTSPCSC